MKTLILLLLAGGTAFSSHASADVLWECAFKESIRSNSKIESSFIRTQLYSSLEEAKDATVLTRAVKKYRIEMANREHHPKNIRVPELHPDRVQNIYRTDIQCRGISYDMQ